MAMASIPQNGRVWKEYRNYTSGSTGIGGSASVVTQYRNHSVDVVRIIGYTSDSDAKTAATNAAVGTLAIDGSGTITTATWEKDGYAPMWSVVTEADTTGAWTTPT